MHFKAHRLPPIHLILSSLLWLHSSHIVTNKKPSTSSLIHTVGGTLSLFSFQRSQPHISCLPSLVCCRTQLQMCLGGAICTDSTTVTRSVRQAAVKFMDSCSSQLSTKAFYYHLILSQWDHLPHKYGDPRLHFPVAVWCHFPSHIETSYEMRWTLLELYKPEEVNMPFKLKPDCEALISCW